MDTTIGGINDDISAMDTAYKAADTALDGRLDTVEDVGRDVVDGAKDMGNDITDGTENTTNDNRNVNSVTAGE